MKDPRIAERYDEKLAATFLGMNDKLTGLPEFLGVRIDVSNDGRARAAAQGTVTLRPPRDEKSA